MNYWIGLKSIKDKKYLSGFDENNSPVYTKKKKEALKFRYFDYAMAVLQTGAIIALSKEYA